MVTSTDSQFSQILERGSLRVIEPSGVLWHEGVEARCVGFVLAGVALMSRFDHVGLVEAPIDVIGPGHLLGHDALLDSGRRSSSARALTRMRISLVHVDDLHDLMRRAPKVACSVTGLLARHAAAAERAAVASRDPIVEGRVVRWLAHLAEQLGGGASGTVIPLSQAELAQLCATRRPTLNGVLRSLALSGTIDVSRGRIIVRDAGALSDRYEQRGPRLAS
jgi:CRP-like cAMP-binding protein